MSNYLKEKNTNPIGENEYMVLLSFLNNMFSEDYTIENSKAQSKARLTFDILKDTTCTVHELHWTLKEFSKRHLLHFWMPAHIYQIWKSEFGPVENFI